MMDKIAFWGLLGCLAGLFLPFVGFSQTILHGLVKDENGEILPDALVEVSPSLQRCSSDSSGQFWVEIAQGGAYQIQVSYLGYQTQSKKIQINPEMGHLDVVISLKEIPNQLQTVEVSEDISNSNQLPSSSANRDYLLSNLGGNLSQSLANMAGLQAINVGVGIAKPVIRGLAGNRIIVLNDGIRQEGQQWGNDHGLETDALDVEKVQLIKGAASLQYGGDAMGGILKLNPVAIPTKNGFSAQVLGLYKTNNAHYGGSGQLSARWDRLFVQIRLSQQRFGDYQVRADSFFYNGYRLPIYQNRLKNTAGQEQNARISLGYVSGAAVSRISAAFFSQNAGLFMGAVATPRSYSLQPDGNNRNIELPKQKVGHFRLNWHHLQPLNGGKTLTLDIGYQYNTRQEYSYADRHNRPPTGSRSLGLDLRLKTLSLDVFLEKNGDKFSYNYGGQLQRLDNQASGFEYLIPSYQNHRIGGFWLGKYQHFRHTFSAGLRVEGNSYQTQTFSQQVFDLQNQIISINRSLADKNQHAGYAAGLSWAYKRANYQLKTNLGKSYRAPAMNELYSDGIHHGTFRHERGNPNLKTENGYQLDLSGELNGRKWGLKPALFANFFRNFIFLRPSGQFSNLPEGGQVYKYSQSDVFYTGGELEWSYELQPWLQWGQSWEYVYNYNLATGLGLPFSPAFNLINELQGNLKLKKESVRLHFNLNHLYSAAQNRVDRNELPSPAYHLFNLSANVQFLTHKSKYPQTVRVGVQVQNLLNTPYLQHLSRYRLLNLPEQGRNIIVSLWYQFG